jgi:haloalkane dehalogenase
MSSMEVKGSKIHYIDEGKGDPILFLHGIPTSSYLWRNVIPGLSHLGRCIAPDLIGMGDSDKPDIDYTVFDHIAYIDAFIEKLGLKNITIVMHGWGSLIGFDYAMRYSKNVKGLVFLEAHIRPAVEKEMVSLPVQERSTLLHLDESMRDLILNTPYYVEKSLPMGTMKKLPDAILSAYKKPFEQKGSGKPVWQYLQDLPLGDKKTKVLELIANYSKKLERSDIPKLMLYAMPGFNVSIETVMWAQEHFPNLTVVEIEDTLHYAMESEPEQIAEAIGEWMGGHNKI